MKYPFSSAILTESGGYVYPAADKCIYCGETDGLTREHIVPYGLFGDLILPSGSCKACAKITSGLEAFVQQRMLGIHRRKFGFPSQSGKKRRGLRDEKFKIHAHVINADGTKNQIELKQGEYPFYFWALPVFDLPGLTIQPPIRTEFVPDHMKCVVSHEDALTVLQLGGGILPVRMPSLVYHQQKFTRFLAKMAHAYAIATIGEGSFKPVLTEFIRDGIGEPRMFVGGETELSASKAEVFSIALGSILRTDGKLLLAARIRLLAYMGTPSYIVVVGQGFDDDIMALKHCSYAKSIKITITGQDGAELFST